MIRNRIYYLIVLCGILCNSCQQYTKEIPDDSYIAFSLRETQAILKNKNASIDSSVLNLAGITRLAGMVIDRKNKDIILIGKKSSKLPEVTLDDFVTALRARLIHDELPMVSIDPVPNSAQTGMQQVRFAGHLDQTSFGYQFLTSDILLKKYSLGIEEQTNGITSYGNLLLQDELANLKQQNIETKAIRWVNPDSIGAFKGRGLNSEKVSQSRFWFNYKNPCQVRIRGDVFCIMALDIIIERELTIAGKKQDDKPGSTNKKLPDEQFSELFTDGFYTLSDRYPILKKLKALFDMTAIAEGLKNTKDLPDINFLLKEYPVKVVNTQKEFPLIKKCAVIERNDGKTNLVQLSGGIETSVEMQWLNGGDVSYLEKAVLDSRPDVNSLFWRLPLDDWKMPNSKGLTQKKLTSNENDKSGCSVISSSVVLSDNTKAGDRVFDNFTPQKTADAITTKGVQMKMEIDTTHFKEVDSLKQFGNGVKNLFNKKSK